MKRGEASTKPKRPVKGKTLPMAEKASTSVKAVVKTKAVRSTKLTEKKKLKVKVTPEPVQKASISREDVKYLLRLRKEARLGRPEFHRQESWRYLRIQDRWRKPKGIDSKMRKMIKGWPKIVKVGFRGPVVARGIHPSGFRDILVNTVKDLDGLNPERDAVRLATRLGARKRKEILDRADDLGLKVLNPRGIRVIRKKE
jgi:large subunit ribosomal protein L32e